MKRQRHPRPPAHSESLERLVSGAQAHIRAAFAEARQQVAHGCATFVAAYDAELQRRNAGAKPGEPRTTVPLVWLRQSGWGPRLRAAFAQAAERGARQGLAVVTAGQAQAARSGDQHASDLILRALEPGLRALRVRWAQISGDFSGTGAQWNYVPTSAMRALQQSLLGSAGNGQPLRQLFDTFGQEANQSVALFLNTALSAGMNPRQIAGSLADVLNSSTSRALTIARNEMIGAYVSAQNENYRANSDVVDGWLWHCDVASACIACCDMDDGTVHPVDEDLEDHVCGKCVPLPVTKGWDDILGPLGIDASDLPDTRVTNGYQSGVDWFNQTLPSVQRDMLGPAKFAAWQAGDLQLADLVGKRDDGAWGKPIYEKSLKELGLDARDYLGADVQAEAMQTAETAAIKEPEPPAAPAPDLGTADDIRAREQQAEEFFANAKRAGNDYRSFGGEYYPELSYYLPDSLGTDPAFGVTTDKWLVGNNRLNPEAIENQAAWNRKLNTDPKTGEYTPWPRGYADTPDLVRREMAYQSIIEEYHTYANGSSSARQMQIALQEAARREFGLTNAASFYDAEKAARVIARYGDEGIQGLQNMLRDMYDRTQADFAAKGITEVQVFRGMRWKEGVQPAGVLWDGAAHADVVGLQPLTSVTTQIETALDYANGGSYGAKSVEYRMVVADVVPVSQILATPYSGFGAPIMREMVILGGDQQAAVLTWLASQSGNLTVDDVIAALADTTEEG